MSMTETNKLKMNMHTIKHNFHDIKNINQGPVVQSIVSLTSSLVVKMLTVLVRKISNSQLFLLKNVSSFCNFFSAKI